MSARTTMLARKVAEAKAQRLGCFEHFLSKTLGTLVTAPSLFLSGFVTVPANTAVAIFRFGKLDVILNRPGLYWLPVFFEGVTTFTGTQTHKMDELHVVDAAGNPIIVRALLEFAIEDPAALKIATNMSLAV
jgi:regulator of protease activity HflC (stomatin/prohibitin superfamily)